MMKTLGILLVHASQHHLIDREERQRGYGALRTEEHQVSLDKSDESIER
jgi:hypothetical protein